MSLSVFIIDPHPIICMGLRQVFETKSRYKVVGQVHTSDAALSAVTTLKPDFILLDPQLPDRNGIEIVDQIRSLVPQSKIVIFSEVDRRYPMSAAVRAGINGYILKTSKVEELIQALAIIQKGKFYLSNELSSVLVEDYRNALLGKGEPQRPVLTERDRQVLRLIAEGCRSKEIGQRLSLSAKSVEAHRTRLMKRLDCDNPAALIRYAIREGIITP